MKSLIHYYHYFIKNEKLKTMSVTAGKWNSFTLHRGEPLPTHLFETPVQVHFYTENSNGDVISIFINKEGIITDKRELFTTYKHDIGLGKWRYCRIEGTGSVLDTITEEELFQDMTNENRYGRIHEMQQYLLEIKDKLL